MNWRSLTLSRITRFLGLRPSFVGLLAGVVLLGMGERLAERFLPIYLVALGGGVLAVGMLNGLQNLLGAIYSYVGGEISDRLGTRRALLVFNLAAILGYAIVLVFPYWQAVLAAAVLFLAWSAISLPATMSLIAERLPEEKHVMGVSLHSLVRRVPMALGPVAGGALIAAYGEQVGVRAAFGVALLMAASAIVIQDRLIPDAPRARARRGGALELWHAMDRPLRRLLVSDILIRFCEQIPQAFVILWCMKTIAEPVSAVEFGVLSAIEMATAFLIYIPVATFADRGGKRIFVTITFLFFTLFPVVLYFSRTFEALVAAFILRGLKEFGEPTRKALIMDLAPRGREAAAFGLYYLVRDTVVSIAAFGGAALWAFSPEANLFTAAACGLAGTIAFAATRPTPPRPTQSAAPPRPSPRGRESS